MFGNGLCGHAGKSCNMVRPACVDLGAWGSGRDGSTGVHGLCGTNWDIMRSTSEAYADGLV